ncbi:protein of unknown function [Agreia sp. COWG]|nr:protein of unknown function [Agreia sp. COWG]
MRCTLMSGRVRAAIQEKAAEMGGFARHRAVLPEFEHHPPRDDTEPGQILRITQNCIAVMLQWMQQCSHA